NCPITTYVPEAAANTHQHPVPPHLTPTLSPVSKSQPPAKET
ncbi:hypothetical protein A2U01_0086695, partial [Trifolium medium]|nr:hypothetical protein [Trifolium medium]